MFDEFYGYEYYYKNEYKAFHEFVYKYDIEWRYILRTAHQVAIEILKIKCPRGRY